jgi:exodeoxyribonuclease VII large subunit
LIRRVDDLHGRLHQAERGVHRRADHRVQLLTARLRAASPFARLRAGRHELDRLEARLGGAMSRRVLEPRHRLAGAAGRLNSLSPLAVLGRGYSLTRTADGRVVRAAREVQSGDPVSVLLHEGSLDCRVEQARERDERPQA